MPKEINLSDTGEIKEKKEIDKIETSNSPLEAVLPETPTVQVKKTFNFKVLIFPIVAVLCLVGIGLFYYFGIYKNRTESLNNVLSLNADYITSLTPAVTYNTNLTLLSAPEEPKTEESPLNGLLFTKTDMDEMLTRRPVAVMIDNQVGARPQSGKNSADIVIEALAEGGITRLMAIFWSEAPEKVGPIRSMRQYFLEWLSEYDPLIIHDGCASSTDARINACGNLYTYGVKDLGTTGAWRWSDNGTRFSPHNEYSSITYAWDYAIDKDWDNFPSTFESWSFKADANIADRGAKTIVDITFHQRLNNGGLYDVIWTYDASTNTYYRKVGGQADIDEETNSQVYAKDIIIQEVTVVQSGDSKGHLITTTIGQGNATFLMDGKITTGTWKKSSRTDRTTYYDSQGNEMIFNRGRIWVEMLSTSDGKFDIIEQ